MKKILFFLFYLTVNSYSGTSSYCCSEYGMTHVSGTGGITEEPKLVEAPMDSSSLSIFKEAHPEYNSDSFCSALGVVESARVDLDYVSGTSWIDGKREGYIYTRHTTYECECADTSSSTQPATPPAIPSGWEILGTSDTDCLTNAPSGTFEVTDICSNLAIQGSEDFIDIGTDRKAWKTIWTTACCGLNNTCIVLKPSTPNPNGRCIAPSIELPANNEVECMSRDASNLIWNADNDIPYCCGEPNSPTCPTDYVQVSNVDGSTPTSEECSAHAGDLSDNYSSVLTEYLTNSDSLNSCCIKASNPTSDNNDTDNGDGSDNNETDDNNDGDNESDNSDNNDSTNLTDEILNDIKSDINTNHEESKEVLNGIKSSIDTASSTNHEDLNNVQNEIKSNGDKLVVLHNAVENQTNVLGDKLDAIGDSTKNLSDLVDSGKDTSDGSDSINEMINGADNYRNSLISAVNGKLSGLIGSAPVFIGSGESSFRANIYGGEIIFDFKIVETLRVYFDVIWLLMLAYFNFIIYKWILQTLIMIGV